MTTQNVWDMFKGIDFADLNGDGNSDVTMRFDDGGKELLMVWFWDAESAEFVYQPEESQLGEDDPSESLGGDVPGLNEDDYSMFEGIWLSDANDQYDSIDIDAEGNWQLYSNGDKEVSPGHFFAWAAPRPPLGVKKLPTVKSLQVEFEALFHRLSPGVPCG